MTSIDIKTGTEGPRHDPYGYEEITVTRPNGDVITLHQGLVEWVQVNNSQRHGNRRTASCRKVFEFFAGCTPEVARRAYERVQYTCKSCGRSDLRCVSGYPGETFNVCIHCDTVVSSDFNESAII